MRLSRNLKRAAALALTIGGFAAGPSTAAAAGPVLVVSDGGFGDYYEEILRGEGLNAFTPGDTSALTAAGLAPYDVVLLADTAIDGNQAAALSGWVTAGGNLIAMRPDSNLAGLLGLGGISGDLSEGYVDIDTTSAPGAGITTESMQFHGTADRWTLNGARSVATLVGTANPVNPAVTLRNVGSAGGQAAAFTYDLARSVVYTRQGNPAFAGQKRDGQSGPIRSDDLFFPDYLDFSKVHIPQADEQQRLLANLVTQMNFDRTPLPRFWYLPRGEKAAFVMTGDDHEAGAGTSVHFDRFRELSAPGCSVADWQCIRGTSYLSNSTPVSPQARPTPTRPRASRSRCTSTRAARTSPRLPARELGSAAARLPRAVPGRDPAANQPHALHRLERLGKRASGRAGERRAARHQLLLLARCVGPEPSRACSRAQASRSGSPTSTAR